MKLCPLLLLFCLCHLGQTEPSPDPSPNPGPDPSTDPSPDPTPKSSPSPTNASAPSDEEEAEGCRGNLSPEDHRALGKSIEQLGLKLLENLPVSPEHPNVILSPLSLAFALAHLTLGAHNETEKLLLQTLHAHDVPCYHHLLGSLVPHFSHKSLEVAARTYVRPGFQVKLSFIEDSLARYQSQPVPIVSVEEVNQWVQNATKGHISSFLESIPHDVVLMLLNAVFFKGEWERQFDQEATSKGEFYLDKENSVSVDMMKSPQYPLRLLHHPELQAQVASFPFKGNTSFLIVLPSGNFSMLLNKLNISDLYKRLPQVTLMQVSLPKVKLDYRQELQGALTSMGLGSLFSGPDLSGISDEPLRVSSVLHATTVELSEEGVEASAATVVTSMRSVSVFSVNSPFLFALVDDASLAPLFMGIITNPAPNGPTTMNDKPVRKRHTGGEHSSEVFSGEAEGSKTLPCITPTGEKEESQHGNGQMGIKNGADETCRKLDNSGPA
ncbi:alpha-2-antiplasmin [Pholidichthys leucotaenia]